MDTLSSISLGVFSGVLTSLLLWALANFFTQLFIPWYQNKIYRGIDIEGIWKGESTSKSGRTLYKYNLSINKQRGHSIEGYFFISNIDYSEEIQSIYKFTGNISDGYISIMYSSADKQAIGLGSLLFKIIRKGNSLEGGMIFMEINSTQIAIDNDIILNREKGNSKIVSPKPPF